MTTQWHCGHCGYVFKTFAPNITNYNAGVAAGTGLRNSQAGNSCYNCSTGLQGEMLVADN